MKEENREKLNRKKAVKCRVSSLNPTYAAFSKMDIGVGEMLNKLEEMG
jgi:hypothetical protein